MTPIDAMLIILGMPVFILAILDLLDRFSNR